MDTHFAEMIKERGLNITTETPVPGQALDKVQIAEGGSNIEVEGHLGTWHVIDTNVVNEDNPLRSVELSTEQNYNQIDGIINNQPTMAQIEEDAKSGKP